MERFAQVPKPPVEPPPEPVRKPNGEPPDEPEERPPARREPPADIPPEPPPPATALLDAGRAVDYDDAKALKGRFPCPCLGGLSLS